MKYLTEIVFTFLILFTLIAPAYRHYYLKKKMPEWILDGLNLTVQGTLIPFLQAGILYQILDTLFPSLGGRLNLSFSASFILNFVFVDYLYYWNHRLFHKKELFPIHIVHHTVTNMDVMATSRNTLWSSFLIIYMWANGLFIFLLKDPSGFIAGMVLTAALDCWRHSKFFLKSLQPLLSRYLFLVTPIDHAVHHGPQFNSNFAANWNFFDKIHGTYIYANEFPKKLGINSGLNFWQKLLYPYR
jgi:sterol desaturase/sphingolipid hydroxylase (fatty acid hydroxylase superfamily)